MKTLATLAAIGGALLIGSPAFSADEAQALGHKHHNSHFKFNHQPHFKHHTPSYTYHQPTYHKPTYYKPTYTYQPTYKNVEICFKWVKDGYGHATKVIIPCPVEHVVVKKQIIEKKVVTEQPVEQKPTEQQPVEQQPTEQQPAEQQ